MRLLPTAASLTAFLPTIVFAAVMYYSFTDFYTITFDDLSDGDTISGNYYYLQWHNWTVTSPPTKHANKPHLVPHSGNNYARMNKPGHRSYIGFVGTSEQPPNPDGGSGFPPASEKDFRMQSMYFGCGVHSEIDRSAVPVGCTIRTTCLNFMGKPGCKAVTDFTYEPNSATVADLQFGAFNDRVYHRYDHYCARDSCIGMWFKVIDYDGDEEPVLYVDDISVDEDSSNLGGFRERDA